MKRIIRVLPLLLLPLGLIAGLLLLRKVQEVRKGATFAEPRLVLDAQVDPELDYFKARLMIDTGVPAIAADAIINFDPSMVEVRSVIEGAFFDTFDYNVSLGKLTIYNYSRWVDQAKSGTGILATIVFGIKKTGKTKLSFVCQQGNSEDSGDNADSAIWSASGGQTKDVISCAETLSIELTLPQLPGALCGQYCQVDSDCQRGLKCLSVSARPRLLPTRTGISPNVLGEQDVMPADDEPIGNACVSSGGYCSSFGCQGDDQQEGDSFDSSCGFNGKDVLGRSMSCCLPSKLPTINPGRQVPIPSGTALMKVCRNPECPGETSCQCQA
ncbi:MAG: cohesin domain-containing protein, partial [Patescibacteria group bacterium]